MLNIIWAGMIIIGVVYGAVSGNMSHVSDAVVDSSKEAISLCMTMLGIMAFWCGIMNVAKECGLIDKLTKKISPFIEWMFPNLKRDGEAKKYISINMIANMLGMGWAATPAGLKAMEALADEEKDRNSITRINQASNEMCAFLVINISSLQLIPVNIIAYRSQYGSATPASIILPALCATTISTTVGIIVCKLCCKRWKNV